MKKIIAFLEKKLVWAVEKTFGNPRFLRIAAIFIPVYFGGSFIFRTDASIILKIFFGGIFLGLAILGWNWMTDEIQKEKGVE